MTSSLRRYDVGVAVDCGAIQRVGSVRASLEQCGTIIRIDHHSIGEPFGALELVDTTAAAVGEMVAELAEPLSASISQQAATCLLASIVEDTGSFQFQSVTPLTFDICSRLIAAGADLHDVVQNLFWKASEGAVRMSARCVSTAQLEADGKLAWTIASLQDFESFGAVQEDVDDVVHDLLRIEGTEVAVLLRETEVDYRVSLRSREQVDVASLAELFSGGGHVRAAGCRIAKSQASVRQLLDAAAAQLGC